MPAPEAIAEMSSEGTDSSEEMQEMMLEHSGGFCCCFNPFLASERPRTAEAMRWERISPEEEKWWSTGLEYFKKAREWSEIVAGPRWKTFIRRFTKNRFGCGGGGAKSGKFHYDPCSYALNFDDGEGQNCHFDDDRLRRDFSSRFVAMPAPARSSTDLGREALSSFT